MPLFLRLLARIWVKENKLEYWHWVIMKFLVRKGVNELKSTIFEKSDHFP